VGVDHVDDELGVLPGFVLRLAHVERAAANVTQIHIPGTHGDFARQKAVGGAVVAAAARLVEHQLRPVLGLEPGHQFQSRWRGNDFGHHQKKPSLFSL
jgi:hypothetical protein